jgi:hypothetical protein
VSSTLFTWHFLPDQDSTRTNRSRRAGKGNRPGTSSRTDSITASSPSMLDNDELRSGVGMHLDAGTHIYRPSPSVRGPAASAGQRFILPDQSSVGLIAVTPPAVYRRPVPLPHVR